MRIGLALAVVIQVAVAGLARAQQPTPESDHAAEEAPRQAARTLDKQQGDDAEPLAAFTDPSFGPQYTIERIVVRGNRKTEQALILGELGLQTGDQVTASDRRVEAARIRLLALGFFLDVRLALARGTGRGGAVLLVDVEERGTVILNALYLGSSAATTFWGGLEVAENNLLGRGISLGTGFVAGTRPDVAESESNLGARLRVQVPPLAGTGVSASATGLLVSGTEFFRVAGSDGSDDPTNFVGLRYRRVGGVVGFGRALTTSTRVFLDFREEGVTTKLPSQSVPLPPPDRRIDFGLLPGFSTVGSLTATIDFDTRSDPLIPRAGAHVALSAEGATDQLLSSYAFIKLVLQGSLYRPAPRGHVIGLHLFGGALFGNAPLYDRFFIGDMNLLLPPRAMGLNFSTQPSRDLLGTSIAGHRYDAFAARILVEYSVPLWRRHRFAYNGNAFIAVGAFTVGSEGAFRDARRTGLAAWPVDLTGDLGVRVDTLIGVFSLSFANALGRLPF